MQTVVRMGLDIAKNAFQVHGVNAQGKVANVAVALAAKHARIIWALLAHGTEYRPAI